MLETMQDMTQEVFNLKGQISSLEYENEKLRQNSQMDSNYKNSSNKNLELQIDKIQMENQKLKKRNNDLLDLKRQSENKIQQLEFQLANLDQKLQLQIKDGYLSMNSKDKQFNQEILNRDRQIQDQQQQLQDLKNQNHKMGDQLSLQLQKQTMNQDYIDKLERGNGGQYNNNHNDDGLGQTITTNKDKGSVQDLKQKHKREVDQIIHDYQRRIDDLERQLGRDSINVDQLEFKINDNRNKNEMLKVYCNLLVNMMQIIYSEIYEFLIQIYEKCVTDEKVNNQSAKVLFVKEIEKLKNHKNGKGQKLGYQLFSYVKKMIKKVVKQYGKEMDDDQIYQTLKAYTGIIVKNKDRLESDKETEMEIKQIIKDNEAEPKINTKKYFLDLFKLLQIKHRYLYPSNNIRQKMDFDLEAFMNLKIMNSFKKIMKELFVFQYQNYIYFQNLVKQQKQVEG